MMRIINKWLSTLSLLCLSAMFLSTTALAAQGWQDIETVTARASKDQLTFQINPPQVYQQIRLSVSNGDVMMHQIKASFSNGEVFKIQLQKLIKDQAGHNETRIIPLAANDGRELESVVLFYRLRQHYDKSEPVAVTLQGHIK